MAQHSKSHEDYLSLFAAFEALQRSADKLESILEAVTTHYFDDGLPDEVLEALCEYKLTKKVVREQRDKPMMEIIKPFWCEGCKRKIEKEKPALTYEEHCICRNCLFRLWSTMINFLNRND